MIVALPELYILLAFAVLVTIAYVGLNTYLKARISREIMEHTTPFSLMSEDHTISMLVLGDSTGVGVGADRAEESVAGRVAHHIGATYVENLAEVGAETEDLLEQAEKAKLPHYSLLLVHIGGNDIIQFHSAKKTGRYLDAFLENAPRADRIIILSAGNVGGATIFPPLFRFLHTSLTLKFHKVFEEVAKKHGGTYVNLYEPFYKDPFLRDPNRYLSMDGLHPSSYGYGLWFEKVKQAL